MKKLLLLCLLTGITSILARAQAPISNVTIRTSEEQDKVTISYDLARNPRIAFYNIKVKITLDGTVLDARGLSGDVGSQVAAGLGKKIIWDVHRDLSELAGELKVEVLTDTPGGGATGPNGPCVPIKTLPAYAGLGGVAASGAGLLITGLTIEGDSKDLYDVYKSNLDASDPVFSDISREDYYAEANKKHKNAQILMIAGGVTIVAGGVIMVSRLIKINNYNKRCGGKMGDISRFKLEPSVVGNMNAPGMGLSLTYQF
ncbi:MAG: hypothetical protein IPL65_11125 [Lewinellaceae bacterium]|nr:hypothetical protein [Lewinellaceae bacterium]